MDSPIPIVAYVTSADVNNDFPFVNKLIQDEINRRSAENLLPLSEVELQELRKTMVRLVLVAKDYRAAASYRTPDSQFLKG